MSLVGRLEDLALSDIFQILSIGKKTGTLVINGAGGNAMIVFRNGLVVRAETTQLEGTLGHDLLKSRAIKESSLLMALEVKKKLPEKSAAEILFDLGAVNKDTLEKASKKRIEKAVYHLLLWHEGDFQFELEDLELKDSIQIEDLGWEVSKGISPEYLLMEGARVHDESAQQEFVSNEELTGETAEEGGWESDWGGHGVAERKDISALKSLTQELRFPNSASEITLLILRFASDIFQRGVLFMVGEKEMAGLGQFGLEIERADERIRETALPLRDSPFFTKIIDEAHSYKGPMEKDKITEMMIKELGGGWPSEVGIFPIIAEGRVAAMLYCDNMPAGEPIAETEGLEIFISQAGLAFEKSLLQRRLQEMQNSIENKAEM
ncbi:MAG: DUF4388 domain-containing protein [Nitrospirae bacterium]|nr:DUF4388 domain-containing protein [Nitrospirota bacterium]